MTCPVDYTCPYIDEVIEFINSIDHDDSEAMQDTMETIRSMNSEMRVWGELQEDQAEEKEIELEERDQTIQELEARIKDLESENESLQEEVWSLEVKLEMAQEMADEI